jgi:hypothetical protein
METSQNQAILGPDFARRVVERVRHAKRRRRLYRWALTTTAACALAAVGFLSLSAHYSARPRTALIVRGNDSPSKQMAAPFEFGSSLEPDLSSFHRPLAFFFPSAITIADSQLSDANYWHSYDPWWNPKSWSD